MSQATVVPEGGQLSGRRRPWLAFLLSLLAPGLGHLYAGFPLQALLVLVAWSALAALSVWLFVEPLGGAVAIWLAALLLVAAIFGVPIHAARVARSGRLLAINRWLRLVVYVVFLVAFSEAATRSAAWIRSAVAEPFRAPAAGMVPTLYPGDHFFVDKRAYDRASPQRGDVVVFWIARDGTQVVPADSRPELPREQFVKRVVGVPGDRIRVVGDTVYLNGAPLPVSRAGSITEAGHQLELWSETINGTSYTIARDPSRTSPDSPEVVVPPGRHFVLGDNRDHSNDSRYWGTVLGTSITGQVSHLYFSRNPSTDELAWARVGMRVAGSAGSISGALGDIQGSAMEPNFVARADIVATLEAWQRGELNAEQVWGWAEARFWPGDTEYDDWEGDSSVANEVLCELDSLPMNLVLPEDIPLHLEFLATPAGQFEEAHRRWRAALSKIDWKARQRNLRNEPPYARFCG